MNILTWIGHKARVAMLTIYGPAELDEEHDPLKRENREYEQQRREEEQAEQQAEQQE